MMTLLIGLYMADVMNVDPFDGWDLVIKVTVQSTMSVSQIIWIKRQMPFDLDLYLALTIIFIKGSSGACSDYCQFLAYIFV